MNVRPSSHNLMSFDDIFFQVNTRIILLLLLSTASIANSCVVWSQEDSLSTPSSDAIHSVEAFQWLHRIILIKEDIACNKQYAQSLANSKAAIDDRHILWFLICDGEMQTNYAGELDDHFMGNISEDYFVRDDVNVILVGKDGGVKRRTDSLNLDELFALIDSMPMRQSEMNR